MSQNGKRRVVVTGMGVVTSAGDTLETFWEAIVNGKSFIKTISIMETSDQLVKIGGEIPGFVPENYMDKKESRRMDRFTQFAMAAAKRAYDDSGLKPEAVDPDRFAVVVSSGAGGLGTIESQVREVMEKGYKRTSPFLVPMLINDISAGRISIEYNAKGPNMAIVTACASGANSIGEAFRMIQHDEADIAFAGGSEAPITPISLAGFAACRALSINNENPQQASRPFDKARDGFVMSEGGGIIIIEELDHAQKRGAKIYAELIGYGRSGDAFDIVQPPPDGNGAARAMKAALRDASIEPEAVGYINAHGTSTPQGDIAESVAIEKVFGKHTQNGLAVSSTKSMTGHMLGAAGSVEAAIAVLTLNKQMLPPTINLDNQDPACNLDYIPNVARPANDVSVTLSNSFGFGGHNATLIFRRWENN